MNTIYSNYIQGVISQFSPRLQAGMTDMMTFWATAVAALPQNDTSTVSVPVSVEILTEPTFAIGCAELWCCCTEDQWHVEGQGYRLDLAQAVHHGQRRNLVVATVRWRLHFLGNKLYRYAISRWKICPLPLSAVSVQCSTRWYVCPSFFIVLTEIQSLVCITDAHLPTEGGAAHRGSSRAANSVV